jgi:hypothetical protein
MRFQKKIILSILTAAIIIVIITVFPLIRAQYILNNFMNFSSYLLTYQEAAIPDVDDKVSVEGELSLNKPANVKFSSFVYYPNCDQLSYAIYYKASDYQQQPMFLFDECNPTRYHSEKIYTNTMDYFITRELGLTKGIPKSFDLYEVRNEKIGTVTLIWR